MPTIHHLMGASSALLGVPFIALLTTSCAMPVGDEPGAGQKASAVRDRQGPGAKLQTEPTAKPSWNRHRAPPLSGRTLSEGARCGRSVKGACEAGTFCDVPQGTCGDFFPPPAGTCTAYPQVCDAELKPVCGCDGVTYGNACRAQQHGQSVAYTGRCEKAKEGEKCGVGLIEPRCDTGLYCSFELGACSETPVGLEGTCARKPTWCAEVWDPVCGCDGETYGNACVAAAHGQSVAHEASCPPVE